MSVNIPTSEVFDGLEACFLVVWKHNSGLEKNKLFLFFVELVVLLVHSQSRRMKFGKYSVKSAVVSASVVQPEHNDARWNISLTRNSFSGFIVVLQIFSCGSQWKVIFCIDTAEHESRMLCFLRVRRHTKFDTDNNFCNIYIYIYMDNRPASLILIIAFFTWV